MPVTTKATRRPYSQETLEEAILAVQGGMTITAASKQFLIPRQTLKDKISGKYAVSCRMGRPSILTPVEEQVLVDWVVTIGAAGFPVSKDQILASVEKVMSNLKRENPFSETGPGEKWFSLFLQRHPEISARVSQALTTSRANVTEQHIRQWFSEVNEYVKTKKLENAFKNPRQIFNCDESAFFLCPKGKKVYVRRGEKHVYSITGNDEKECLTTLVTANAAGELPPPMVVFAYERIPANVVTKFPDSWGIGKSESGWMTGETFYEYISNIFHPWLTRNGVPRPVVLFVDGHASHLTLHLSEFCSNNEIELISLYPNSTHILQPMDVAVFHPLKASWKQTVQQWRCENGAAKIKKEDFAPLMKTAFDSSIKKETVKNGFKCTGLLSLDVTEVNFFKLVNSSRQKAEKMHTHSQWLTLKSHVQYLEGKIGRERLERFKEDRFETEETALHEIWRAATEEASAYKRALEEQDLRRPPPTPATAPAAADGDSTLEDPDIDQTVEADQTLDAVVLATNEDSFLLPVDDILLDPAFNNFEMPFEIDLPVTQIPVDVDTVPTTADELQEMEVAETNSPKSKEEDRVLELPRMLSPVPGTSFQTPEKDLSNRPTQITPSDLREQVSTPFKKALFWPGESQSKKKKTQKKVRLPSAVTSDEWKNYYILLEEKKKNAALEKEKRKLARELNLKIKQEKEESKVNF